MQPFGLRLYAWLVLGVSSLIGTALLSAQTSHTPPYKVYTGKVVQRGDTVLISLGNFVRLRETTLLPPNTPDGLIAFKALAVVVEKYPKAQKFHLDCEVRSGPLQLEYGVLYNRRLQALAFRAEGVWSIDGPSIQDYVRFRKVTASKLFLAAQRGKLSAPLEDHRTGRGRLSVVEDKNLLPWFNELIRQGCPRTPRRKKDNPSKTKKWNSEKTE